MIYAQLDNNNICIGVSKVSGEIQKDNMLQIENYDLTILGKKYENGKWIELSKPPIESIPKEPTNTEVLQTVNNLIADLTIAGVI